MIKHSLTLTAAAVALVGSASAQGLLAVSPDAQGNVDGSLPVTFSTYLGAGYDTNGGSTSGGDSSAYLQGSLGTQWARVTRRGSVGVGLNGGAYYYLDSPEGLDEDVLYNARVDFRFSYRLSERATIRNYAYLSYEVEPDYAIGETLNRRSGQYFYYYDQLNLDYVWSNRFSTRTFFTVTGISYEEANIGRAEDRISYDIGNDFRYAFSRRTTGILGYSFGVIDYDSARNDATEHRGYVGVDQRLNERLSASVRLGATFRDADVTGSNTSPYASFGLSGSLTRKLSLSWVNRYSADNSEAGYADNTALRTALTANYQATEDLSFYAGLSYIHSEKERVQIEGIAGSFSDDAVSASVGANLALSRWVSLTAGYTYYNVSSDISSRDYDRHIISAGIAASWQ